MRQIIEGEQFAECVEKLGGYRAIDQALEPIMDGLMKNPYGFEKFENDWTSFRYARTRRIERFIPSLILIFEIDNDKNVILNWIEEIDDADEG